MATVWWQTGGSNQSEGRRERNRFLKDLAENSLVANHSFNVSHWVPAPIDSLIKNETLLELKADTVIFRHDVFREWAMACLLFDEADRVSQLPLTKPARPDLSRAVELVARMKIENASDAADWLGLLAALSAPGAHSSWRRAILLALVRSEASPQILNTTAPALVYDHAALLCELIRLVLAVEVMPARARFVAAGLDEKNVPASMMVPAGLSWIRLMAWIHRWKVSPVLAFARSVSRALNALSSERAAPDPQSDRLFHFIPLTWCGSGTGWDHDSTC
jgi:hypothetical protein